MNPEVLKGYAMERLCKVQWSAPLGQRLSTCHHPHQRQFVIESAIRFFESGLFKKNAKAHAPGWWATGSRRRRIKALKRARRQVEREWARQGGGK